MKQPTPFANNLTGKIKLLFLLVLSSLFLSPHRAQANAVVVSPELEAAVSQAIKSERAFPCMEPFGEVMTEGHVILDVARENPIIKVYCITSYSNFCFTNGMFTPWGSGGGIPAVITFSQNQPHGYTLLKYQEPEDGEGYLSSLKKLFPQRLHNKALNSQQYHDVLNRQEEDQAREYLRRIGRVAQVRTYCDPGELIELDSEVYDKLLKISRQLDRRLNYCPWYWLGNTERLENGVRYVYETAQTKTVDNCGLFIFRVKLADGTLLAEYQYKIVENEPILIHQYKKESVPAQP